MTLPESIDVIIFDVDGTLYDQRRLRLRMLARLLAECARHPVRGSRAVRLLRAYRHAQEQLRSMDTACDIGAQQLEIACARSGISAAEARVILDRLFETAPLTLLERCIQPGLKELLERARGAGTRLGVFSDYPAEEKLKALGVRHFFRAIVSASDSGVGRLKPHPAGLLACMAHLHAEPRHTIYVGDRTDIDVACAREAEVCPVIIGAPHKGAFVSVNGFDELAYALWARRLSPRAGS